MEGDGNRESKNIRANPATACETHGKGHQRRPVLLSTKDETAQ
jgi:hypothetical protein